MEQKNPHDAIFREIFSNKKYSLDIFCLTLSTQEFQLFDWKTLKSEATVFLDTEGKEKKADLVFSVKLKNSPKTAQIVFLLEHKSFRDNNLLKQLLNYQARIYSKQDGPILPILVYHGEKAEWKSPLSFQESLDGMTEEICLHFGKDILDFRCRLLNLHKLPSWENQGLTTSPILFIMANIWRLNDGVIEEFLKLCQSIKNDKDRKALQEAAMVYIRNQDRKKFSWKKLQEIEKKVLLDKGEKIMPALKILEVEREEGREEGLKEGLEKVALSMIQKGLDHNTIKEYTQLTLEKIKKLAQKVEK